MVELKVITQKIENKKHELIGEVRGDIDVNMNNLNFQVNIFDKDKGSDEKGELKTSISDFFYNYFKPALKGTEWEFLALEPLSMSGVDNKTIKIGDTFDEMSGVLAKSSIDGDITKNIIVSGKVDTNKVGKYTLEYTIKDSIGNSMTVIRTINVRTNTPPAIKGIDNLTIKVGDAFNATDGVTAEDIEDGDITDKIKIAGTVNALIAGTYNVIYEVTDNDGNMVSNTRVITVQEEQKVDSKDTDESSQENTSVSNENTTEDDKQEVSEEIKSE